MNDKKFVECPECAKKPGTPTLCQSCINNRELIEYLQKEVSQTKVLNDLVNSFGKSITDAIMPVFDYQNQRINSLIKANELIADMINELALLTNKEQKHDEQNNSFHPGKRAKHEITEQEHTSTR